jgi:ankyrin repeat protein
MMRSRPAARMAAPMASPTSPDPGADALGQTPLMRAAARGDAELVERLLAAGADRSQTDHRGWTAADHARHAGHEALAQRLTPPAPPAADGQR